jgi:GT2 family glycosyltransferase
MARHVALSVIIASWNTRDVLRALLASLKHHGPATSMEILVVDNGSTDHSAAMVRQEFPAVRLIANDVNLGYAKANNQGFAQSRGEYILLLGSDTVVIDESIHKMIRFLQSNPDVGAVTCRLLNPDRSSQKSCRRFPTLWDGVVTYLSLHALAPWYNMRGFDFHRTQDVDQPAATCLLLRRSLLEKLGLFDERYSILYNDVDLCMRVRKQGWRIVYLAEAEILHHGSRSTTQAAPELRLEMYRNILLYFRTHVGLWSDLIIRPILAFRLSIVTRSLIGLQLMGHCPRKGIV